MNLIDAQQQAVDAIVAARPQGKRAASYGFTLLNRSPRALRGIRGRYERCAARLGYSPAQIAQQWTDIKDIAKLENR